MGLHPLKPKACKVSYNKLRKIYLERTRAAKSAGKIDRTFTRINGAQNHAFRKEKHFAEQQQHIEQSKQQLGVEFQNLANRILEEKANPLIRPIKRHWKPY